ncbi:MAG: diacylglycerol kinase family protein [Clostridiales bacterium]|nr:diacylglycerol kinase family protein [Clostridiales bacterium]
MKELCKSFAYARRGFLYCVKNERNMRIHITVSVYMYSFLLFYDFFSIDRTQLAILLLTNALVFMAEIFNTAIEKTVDMIETRYNKFCEIAKDAAAGAVLVGAVFSVAVGIAVLWQPDAFLKLFDYYLQKPWMIAVFAASLAVSGAFIILPSGIHMKSNNKNKKRKKTK